MNQYDFTDPEILKKQEALAYYFQKKKFSPATIKTYCNYIGYFLEWLPKSSKETTYNDVLQFVNHCREEGRKTRNINMILTAIRHYYTMLGGDNPAAGLYIKGETKSIPNDLLSEEELQQLYEKYPTYNERTQRNKVITGLYIYQGIATDELRKLEPGHIQLSEGKIYIPGTKQTHNKGGRKSRVLKLKANQILELQEYLLVTRPKILADLKTGKRQNESTRKPNKINWSVIEQQLFISLNGSDNIKSSIKFLMDDLRAHNPTVKDAIQIRKSVIVNWLKGKDIREVQYMAGHSSISSTERYRAANLEELEEALKIHHPLA
jgi:integrase/recombinase XerD